jgi:hypothetical protein
MTLTGWLGSVSERGYAANMSSGPVAAELSQLLQSGAEQAVDALRRAAAEGLDVGELTELLRVAFTQPGGRPARGFGATADVRAAPLRAGP